MLCYETDLSEINQTTRYTEFSKGFKFEKKDSEFMILQNYLSRPYSYISMIYNEHFIGKFIDEKIFNKHAYYFIMDK